MKPALQRLIEQRDEFLSSVASSSNMWQFQADLRMLVDERTKPMRIEAAVLEAFGNLNPARPEAELVGIVHGRLARADLSQLSLADVPCHKTVRAHVRAIVAKKTGNSD